MATRVEILLGYQILDKIRLGNTLIHCASAHLRGVEALTLEPLEDSLVPSRKRMCEDDCIVIDVEVSQRLINFLTRFSNEDLVREGLKHFKIPRIDLDEDGLEVLHHADSIRNVNALLNEPDDFNENGKLLSLYKERVTSDVEYHECVSSTHQRINIFQDVLNVIAFELRGICSYTGAPLVDDLETRKQGINARITLLEREQVLCPETDETKSMFKVLSDVKGSLPSALFPSDLEALGKYVDEHVPHLPLVRRWWSHGI